MFVTRPTDPDKSLKYIYTLAVNILDFSKEPN